MGREPPAPQASLLASQSTQPPTPRLDPEGTSEKANVTVSLSNPSLKDEGLIPGSAFYPALWSHTFLGLLICKLGEYYCLPQK